MRPLHAILRSKPRDSTPDNPKNSAIIVNHDDADGPIEAMNGSRNANGLRYMSIENN